MDLRKVKSINKIEETLPFKELRKAHESICRERKGDYKQSVTEFENRFYKKLKKETKLKIYRSIWIGKYNYDFYLPSIKSITPKSKQMKGLVIEIDGSIHDREFKMRVDEKKGESLRGYEIGLGSVQNKDVKMTIIQDLLIAQLSKLKRHDSRAVKRNLRNIYICTILLQLDRTDVLKRFSKLTTTQYNDLLREVER